MYEIHLSRKADKFLKKLKDQNLKERISDVLIELSDSEKIIGKQIKGMSQPTYRLKLGTHRIIYSVDHHAQIMRVLDIKKRNETTYK